MTELEQYAGYAQGIVVHHFTFGAASLPDHGGVPEEAAARLRRGLEIATPQARDFWAHKIKRDQAILALTATGIDQADAERLFSFTIMTIKKATKGQIPMPAMPKTASRPWWRFW